MLKIYKAYKFIKVLEEGGHTKPWLIEILVEEKKTQAVILKLYTKEQLESKNSITAEVIGNVLAQEFDFLVPEAILIETTGNFYQSLPNEELKTIILGADDRLKFGSFYMENTSKLIPELPIELLEPNLSLETLYAFDNFIRNGDRGKAKTNMLIQNETSDIYLIDHEMALDINQDTIQMLEQGILKDMFTKYHFSFDFLKERENIDFYEFTEYFRSFKLEKLNPYFEQLKELGFDTRENEIIQYFSYIQNNLYKFLEILKKSLL